MQENSSSWLYGILIGSWLIIVAAGMFGVALYKAQPGAPSTPSPAWPENTWERPAGKAVLVMVMHPMCACSQASVTELRRVSADLPGSPAIYVLFRDFDPADKKNKIPEKIETMALWKRAAAIPGVTMITDVKGRLAKTFNAATSGDLIVYDKLGRLLFHGGITALRGHEGDSFGRERLLALLNGKPTDRATSPVFGCALDDDFEKPGLLKPASWVTAILSNR